MTDIARGLMLNIATVDPAFEEEFNRLTSPDHPLRHELWKIYDDAVGSFAKRSRRFFWQIYP